MNLLKDMKRLGRPLLDFALPPRCPLCFSDTLDPHNLCGPCWAEIQFISDPQCTCCGLPFEYIIEENTHCGGCLTEKPSFNRLRAVFKYDDASKPLLMRFKHGDGTYLAPMLAKWLALIGKDFFNATDLLIPVPLHWTRLLKRRYNQAGLLAREVFFQTGVAWDPKILKRTRRTPSQGTKPRRERVANVATAFDVPSSQKTLITGKSVLLIDDVYTTGATTEACTKALLKAGAREVNVLVLARVVYQ